MALLAWPAELGQPLQTGGPERMNTQFILNRGGAPASRRRPLWLTPRVWQCPWPSGTGQRLVGQDFIWFDQRVEETSAEQGSFPETLLSSQTIRQVREVEILSVHTEPLLSWQCQGHFRKKTAWPPFRQRLLCKL